MSVNNNNMTFDDMKTFNDFQKGIESIQKTTKNDTSGHAAQGKEIFEKYFGFSLKESVDGDSIKTGTKAKDAWYRVKGGEEAKRGDIFIDKLREVEKITTPREYKILSGDINQKQGEFRDLDVSQRNSLLKRLREKSQEDPNLTVDLTRAKRERLLSIKEKDIKEDLLWYDEKVEANANELAQVPVRSKVKIIDKKTNRERLVSERDLLKDRQERYLRSLMLEKGYTPSDIKRLKKEFEPERVRPYRVLGPEAEMIDIDEYEMRR